jgi:Retrotransposon gag protein
VSTHSSNEEFNPDLLSSVLSYRPDPEESPLSTHRPHTPPQSLNEALFRLRPAQFTSPESYQPDDSVINPIVPDTVDYDPFQNMSRLPRTPVTRISDPAPISPSPTAGPSDPFSGLTIEELRQRLREQEEVNRFQENRILELEAPPPEEEEDEIQGPLATIPEEETTKMEQELQQYRDENERLRNRMAAMEQVLARRQLSSEPPSNPLTEARELQQLRQRNQQLEQEARQRSTSSRPAPDADASSKHALKIAVPDFFDGTKDKFLRFFNQVLLFLAAVDYSDKESILFILSYMKGGSAEIWASNQLARLTREHWINDSLDDFFTTLEATFGDTDAASTARTKLSNVSQGKDTVDEYIVKFEAYESLTGYGPVELLERFQRGLVRPIYNRCWNREKPPTTLAEWKLAASQYDRLWRNQIEFERRNPSRQSSSKPAANTSTAKSTSTPRPSGSSTAGPSRAQSTASSRPFIKSESTPPRSHPPGTCYICGAKDHYANRCPKKPGLQSSAPPRQTTPVGGATTTSKGKTPSRKVRALITDGTEITTTSSTIEEVPADENTGKKKGKKAAVPNEDFQ